MHWVLILKSNCVVQLQVKLTILVYFHTVGLLHWCKVSFLRFVTKVDERDSFQVRNRLLRSAQKTLIFDLFPKSYETSS